MTNPGTAPTILVVEDDDDTRASLAELLEERGYIVVPASNGCEAEAYLRSHPPPSCMVLDLWMPIMDGWTLAADMKRGRLPHIPTVVTTAAEPHWGYPTPLHLILRKPLDARKLLAIVGTLAPIG